MNFENLKKCIMQYADLWELGDDFINWVETENIFCNTLVDRINTGFPKDEKIELDYEDNMINTSEYFHLWVIEGYGDLFKEIPFDKCDLNVILTDKLEMYRTRKVRILNGAHTSMIPYALLSGLDTVKACMEDETMSAHLKKCVFDDGTVAHTKHLTYDAFVAGEGVKVIGTYAAGGDEYLEGYAAITETKCGKGRIIMVGAALECDGFLALINRVASEHGIYPI